MAGSRDGERGGGRPEGVRGVYGEGEEDGFHRLPLAGGDGAGSEDGDRAVRQRPRGALDPQLAGAEGGPAVRPGGDGERDAGEVRRRRDERPAVHDIRHAEAHQGAGGEGGDVLREGQKPRPEQH